jgi:hypothetical protein
MASDLTTLAHIFRRKYTPGQVEEVASREHPTYNLVPKRGGFTGELMAYAIDYAFPQGIASGDSAYTNAIASITASAGKQLHAYRKKKVGIVRLNGEAMAACKDDGAFYDFTTKEVDRVILEMGDRLAFDLQRDGNSIRGRRASLAGEVITLTDANDVRNFKVGMMIGADDTATGLSPRTGSTTITAIDEDAGTITVADNTDIALFANNDYLFVHGDPGNCLEGFEACTPLTAPSATLFRNIDRTTDIQGLSGVRVTSTGSIVADLGTAAVRAGLRGKKLKMAVLNPVNFWTVSQQLGAKVEYDSAGGTAEVGFEFIYITTPGGGRMKVYSDPDCPTNRGRLFDNKAHYIQHLKGFPHIRTDGNGAAVMARLTDQDAVQVDVRAWGNYFQSDTAAHGVISIA